MKHSVNSKTRYPETLPKLRLLTTILMVLFLNIFVYHEFGTFAFTAVAAAFTYCMYLLHVRNRPVYSRILIGIALFAAGMISVRSNPAVIGISVLVWMAACAGAVYVSALEDGFYRHLSELILTPLRLFFSAFEGALNGWKFLLTSRDTAGGRIKSAVIGLAVGIPLTLMLTGLLAQGDPIFARFTQSVFSGAAVNRIITHLFVSCISFVVIVPLAFLNIRKLFPNVHGKISTLRFSREMTVVLALVCVLVAAFLVIQWPYIFVRVAAETDLSRFGVATYSEYVKRGFTEFIFVSVLLYVISWGGLLARRGSRENSILLTALQFTLFTEAGIFILSVFRRIALYVQFHGLTLGRVYGGFVLLAVAWLFVTLAGRLLKSRIRWVAVESIGIVLIYLLVVFTNAERIIARKYPPTVNGSIDYVYLSRLSSDGSDGWKQSYDWVLAVIDRLAVSEDPVIPRDDRTQIFYSGIILRQIFQKYHRLTLQYATPEQLREYVQTMYLGRSRAIEKAMPDISRRAAEEKKAGLENGAYVLLQKQVLEESSWLGQQRELSIGNAAEAAARIRISHSSVFEEDSIPAMYAINTLPEKSVRAIGAADRIYLWNYSDARAYESLRRTIPIPVLLLSASEYFSLQYRISRQPLSEQDHAQDSSFDGPFLSPLY